MLLLYSLAFISLSECFCSALNGVSSSKVALYQPIPESKPPRWKCLNSTQEILHSAVNDNYCDCEDGTDEPGTDACPNGWFHCANRGHIGADIRSSRVNDGLCEPECCDGSDEPLGVCPDICDQVGEEYRRAADVERKLRKTGSKIRSTYIAHAQKEKRRLEQSVEKLRADVERNEAEEARLLGILKHSESLGAAMIETRKTSSTYGLLKDYVSALSALSAREDKLRERLNTLETILVNLKNGYNPNYQDMAVLEAVRGWDALKPSQEAGEVTESSETTEAPEVSEANRGSEEGVPSLEDQGTEDLWNDDRIRILRDTDALEALLDHERHIGSTREEIPQVLFSIENYIPDSLMPLYESAKRTLLNTLHSLSIINAAIDVDKHRATHQSALNVLRQSQDQLKQNEDDLDKLFDPAHFGKQGEWKKLDGECIEKDIGDYTYSLCFFDSAHQKSRNGGSNNLGSFSSWNESPSAAFGTQIYYSQQNYKGGARCWNGPERSVHVELSCGTENALLSVSEPEKCEYHYVATTPALCWPDSELQQSNLPREDL
ncbi:endoplasmic reticulum protein [Cantharellus anzutake]|uniref:endoplasmic reticulum protein n=1 Tax=Cantharellus anzutake TaxID=1750568 RepID=UPI00190618C9|nr:endoplasmic reticulum protein [Cantharellus anzutake]KAF8324464.1 endoplasmic reticulum protein [Cantharellus anzutake]